MIENDTAKLEKPDNLRRNSWRYPSSARSCSSASGGAVGVTAGSGARALIGGLLALHAPMIRPVEQPVNDLDISWRRGGGSVRAGAHAVPGRRSGRSPRSRSAPGATP